MKSHMDEAIHFYDGQYNDEATLFIKTDETLCKKVNFGTNFGKDPRLIIALNAIQRLHN